MHRGSSSPLAITRNSWTRYNINRSILLAYFLTLQDLQKLRSVSSKWGGVFSWSTFEHIELTINLAVFDCGVGELCKDELIRRVCFIFNRFCWFKRIRDSSNSLFWRASETKLSASTSSVFGRLFSLRLKFVIYLY